MRSLLLLGLFCLVAGCSKSAPVAVVAPADGTNGPPELKGEKKDVSPLPQWAKAFREPTRQLAATDAILQIAKIDGAEAVVPALVEQLADRRNAGAGQWFSGRPNSTREAVLMCLLKLGPAGEAAAVSQALPVLQKALADPDADVREHAAWAITRLGAKAKPAQKDLVKLLAEDAKPTRFAAYQALQSTGFTGTADAVALLKHKDAAVRSDAAEALGWLPPPAVAALPALIEALKDEDAFVARTAAEAVGKLGPAAKDAVAPLVEILKSATEEQFQNLALSDLAAMIALRRIGSPAVPALIETLKDKNFLARFQAALALGLIGPGAKDALDPLTALMNAEKESADVAFESAVARFLVGGEPAESLDYLTTQLRRTDLPVAVRSHAVLAIARFGPKAEPAVEALVQLLKSDQEVMRKAVVVALKNIGSGAKPAVPALGVLLSDEDLARKLVAADILKGLGTDARAALPDFIKALSDTDNDIRRIAAEAIAGFGPEAKAAVPELAKVIVNKEYKQPERIAAADALAAMGKDAKDAVPALTEALTLRDPMLALAAAKAIGRMGPVAKDAVPGLVKSLTNPRSSNAERNGAILALGLIGPDAKEAVEPLKALATKPQGDQRLWAAAALARIVPADAAKFAPVVLEVVADKSGRRDKIADRAIAIETLELLGTAGKDATSDLLALARDNDPKVRVQALRGLAFVTADGKATVPVLVRAMNDKELTVRAAAVRALGLIGPNAAEAVTRLKELATSGTQLSDEARAALARIEKK